MRNLGLPGGWRWATSVASGIISRVLQLTVGPRRSWGQDQRLQGCNLGFEAVDLHVGLHQRPLGRCSLDVGLLNHPVRFFEKWGCEVLEFRFHLELSSITLWAEFIIIHSYNFNNISSDYIKSKGRWKIAELDILWGLIFGSWSHLIRKFRVRSSWSSQVIFWWRIGLVEIQSNEASQN